MLTSVKTVILKVIRDLGLGSKEIPWQDLVEWCAEGLQHIGAYSQYEEKVAHIAIHNHTGKLPCDYYRARANTFPHKIVKDGIQVAFCKGHVHLNYLALPLDEEGYPLIPDNVQYATALFWKCAMQLAIRGDLVNKELSFQVCKQRWDWYCKQAGASNVFNHQTADTFATHWLSYIPQVNQAELGFPSLEQLPPHHISTHPYGG